MFNFKRKSLISLVGMLLLIIFVNTAWSMENKEEGEHGINFWKEIWKWVNFIILVSVIYKFLSKPAKEFLSTRIENIKRMLADSKDALGKGEKKLMDAEKMLEGLGAEIEGIRKNANRMTELEKERIEKEIEEISRKIAEQTKNDMEQIYKKARIYISNELINEATRIAEETLKKEFTKDDQKILVKKYINALERLN